MNVFIGIGRLTRDPELKYTAQGDPVTNFSIAINEGADRVLFLDCTAWRKTAELAAEYLRKGREVCVRGRIQRQEWDDRNDGTKRYKWIIQADQVQFLGDRPRSEEEGQQTMEGTVSPLRDQQQDLSGLQF